tara:strand:+ start:531 stop:1466 length:936 start_codon:yes stop_codon:yes gene_type:complete
MIKIQLPDYGFFAIVNYAIDCLLIAKNKNLDIFFEWKSSLYGDHDNDCWKFYFENNNISHNHTYEDVLNPGSFIIKYGENKRKIHPIGPIYKYNGGKTILRNPILTREDIVFLRDKLIISKDIKKELSIKIDELNKNTNLNSILGYHFRGYGRLDGGTDLILRKIFSNFKTLFQIYRNCIENFSKERKFYLATDSSELLKYIKKNFKNNLINHNVNRSDYGENHLKNKYNRFTLGKEILLEILTLSKCKKIIGYPSNIRNFLHILHDEIIYPEEIQLNFKFKNRYNLFEKYFNSIWYSLLEKIRLYQIKKK